MSMPDTVVSTQTARVGDPAPVFRSAAYMPDGSFGDVNLADYRGKYVVLFFWPLDFTFVCPTEIRGFEEARAAFEKEGAKILGVSVDSKYCHKAWVENGLGRVGFPLLSDITKEISRSFGVLLEEDGVALRGTFIIDPEGKVMSSTTNFLNTGRNVGETLRTLQAIKTGGLTACNWKPGEATL
jgi:peroxiredoxin (alkyl hydroperoxide reductase subunit C)